MNRALRHRPATIELADGRVVEDAQRVEVGPTRTTWQTRHRGAQREVATAEVARILVRPRDARGLAPFAGFAAGVLVGLAAFNPGGQDCGEVCFAGVPEFAATVVAGTVAGVVYLARTEGPAPVVVYAGPSASAPTPE